MTEQKETMSRVKVSKSAQTELDKAQEQFENFDNQIKSMTMDHMNQAPKDESVPKGAISNREAQKSTDVYLKPHKTIGCRDKFNEDYREQYNFDKEYVQFIAYNKEVTGETIDIWTRPYGGMPAEEWLVPCNKAVWGPRYLAEQIKRKSYHRLVMEDRVTGGDGTAKYYGQMAVDTTVNRLEAHPVSTRKSVFMGANNF